MLSNLPEMLLKLLQKKAIQKATEATSDLIGYEIANKITVPKNSQQSNSETVTIENDEGIPKSY